MLTDDEILDAFIKNDPAIEKEIHRAFDDFKDLVTPRGYAIEWLKELKAKGYRVWYLSNFSCKAERECADCLSFMPYMDGGILSYRDHLIKPDSAIYELLLARFGLMAEESVFIDDTLINVEAAEKLGIHGIHFKTKEQTEEELRKICEDEFFVSK
jgi:putative hydrolase of the HAD superfamily